jgi:hypothetical protein
VTPNRARCPDTIKRLAITGFVLLGRPSTLQRFMLVNDSVTIAVEIPIWLTPADIDALETEHGVCLVPKDHTPRTLAGHIDSIQVRNGAVHVLDYKPDARG